MTDEELTIYIEEKKELFTGPEAFPYMENKVSELLNTSKFTFFEKVLASWMFELLCFTIHTSEGKALYLKLLNHVTIYCPNIAQKYWEIFDNQENMKERYRN